MPNMELVTAPDGSLQMKFVDFPSTVSQPQTQPEAKDIMQEKQIFSSVKSLAKADQSKFNWKSGTPEKPDWYWTRIKSNLTGQYMAYFLRWWNGEQFGLYVTDGDFERMTKYPGLFDNVACDVSAYYEMTIGTFEFCQPWKD